MKTVLTKRLSLAASIAFLLMACQGQKQGAPQVAPQVTVNADREGGTDNAGGGNGIKGKPLDSYIVRNLADTPAYKNFVEPLRMKLAQEFPQLAADFYHITHNRDWYFIPTKLDEISKNILGTYAKTDQMALQDLNKIWIDQLQYAEMSERDQATLIIHEIMMGVKLMKFKSRQDNCIAKAAMLLIEPQQGKTYNDQKKSCRRTYPVVDGASNEKFKLTSDDYDLIRKLVSFLDSAQPDIEEVKSLMETHGYRKYDY